MDKTYLKNVFIHIIEPPANLQEVQPANFLIEKYSIIALWSHFLKKRGVNKVKGIYFL
jgi:hypothetical protein